MNRNVTVPVGNSCIAAPYSATRPRSRLPTAGGLPGELAEPIELREALLPDIRILDVEPATGEQLRG